MTNIRQIGIEKFNKRDYKKRMEFNKKKIDQEHAFFTHLNDYIMKTREAVDNNQNRKNIEKPGYCKRPCQKFQIDTIQEKIEELSNILK